MADNPGRGEAVGLQRSLSPNVTLEALQMLSKPAFARKGLSSPLKERLIPTIPLGCFFLLLYKPQSPCNAPTCK